MSLTEGLGTVEGENRNRRPYRQAELLAGARRAQSFQNKKRIKPSCIQKVFATANCGRSISKYRQNENGLPRVRVVLPMRSSISEKGKVKITVVSEQGKEAVVAILGPADEFCGGGGGGGKRRDGWVH